MNQKMISLWNLGKFTSILGRYQTFKFCPLDLLEFISKDYHRDAFGIQRTTSFPNLSKKLELMFRLNLKRLLLKNIPIFGLKNLQKSKIPKKKLFIKERLSQTLNYHQLLNAKYVEHYVH